MSPVAINGVDKQGVYINGAQVKQALDAANETVDKGVYDATTLSAVDADLATANIKNGITMFGFAGSADVHDISDATAVEAEVLDPETFYAVGGGIRTGTMPTVALAAGSSAYPAGYHAGDGGGLPAIDADLATGNIKNGITIFNVAGSTDVRDSTDADLTAAEARTGKTFYAGGGARKTGTGTKTLSVLNDTVAAGYYAATTLSAVDDDLAPANIKDGVTIFGKLGTLVEGTDISDADAVEGGVKQGQTFYSVAEPRKTGTMPTVALDPALNEYPAGYHAGEASLTAVDAELAEGNIKDGVTIFGVLGTFIGDVPDWYATETLQNSNDSTRTYTGTSYQKKKETRLNEAFTGSIRIKFSLNTSAGAGGNGRLYRNGVALGLERTVPFSWTVFSEDFTGLEWESGDLIQVYLKSYIGDSSIQTQDLQLCYNAEADPVSTTNQDP